MTKQVGGGVTAVPEERAYFPSTHVACAVVEQLAGLSAERCFPVCSHVLSSACLPACRSVGRSLGRRAVRLLDMPAANILPSFAAGNPMGHRLPRAMIGKAKNPVG